MRILCALALAAQLAAQTETAPLTPPVGIESETPSLRERIWLSGQANFIREEKPSFYAKYSGPNSLSAAREHATSSVITLYTGFQITRSFDVVFDVESESGYGIGNATGLAGFVNVDALRDPKLSATPYVARAFLHWTLPLSGNRVPVTRNPVSLSSTAPERRIEFRLGKFSAVDFFDLNSVGSDSHLQFINWTTVNQGTWDFPADPRGYTYGLLVEWYDRFGTLRGEEVLMSKSNGALEWSPTRARGEALELELHPKIFPSHETVLRPMLYANHSDLARYRDAISGYESHLLTVPQLSPYRRQGRVKAGVSVNVEQLLTDQWRVFGRVGGANGSLECTSYTEVDRSASIGTDLAGKRWRRPDDRLGLAFVNNAIVPVHQRYLALGGLGLVTGDGDLNYRSEKLTEFYYTAHLWRGISLAILCQHVDNPGYNHDRGPVWVTGIRLHLEDGIPLH